MADLNRKFVIRRWVAMGVVGGAAIALLVYLFLHVRILHQPPERVFKLPTLTSIENYLRIEVTPVKWDQNQELIFYIRLESTQNPDILDLDKTDMALLTDDQGNLYKPTMWKQDKSGPYERSGFITFRLPSLPKRIQLTIFELTDRKWTWNLAGPR